MEIKKANNYNSKRFKNRTNKTYKTPQEWDLIVNHITEGLMPGVKNWLENPAAEVSVHFLITRNGEIYQFIDLVHGSWGAVNRNPSSTVLKERKVPANLIATHIEHEGRHSATRGKLTKAQYDASLFVHKYIITEYEKAFNKLYPVDREHIIGHYEVDTVNRTKSDPGYEFPWDELMTDLTAWHKELHAPKVVEPPVEVPINDPVNGPYISKDKKKLWFRPIALSHLRREPAQEAVDALLAAGYKGAWLQAATVDDGESRRTWYRAIAGSFETRYPAQARVDRLLQEGYHGAWLQAVQLPILEEE